MSRSGYSDDCENLSLYRNAVDRAIWGKRGQAFLQELATAMDAMPDKILISGDLIDGDGACCALGIICKVRGIDALPDAHDSGEVGVTLGIATSMAAEIAFENDDEFSRHRDETPKDRWTRMREWVANNLRNEPAVSAG